MKRNLLTIFLFFVSASCGFAQISEVRQLDSHPMQYQKAEWGILLTGVFVNPYLQQELTLDMLIKAPSGKKLILPCYYESGESAKTSSWKARFTPQENGLYRYQFRLTQRGKPVMNSPGGSFHAALVPGSTVSARSTVSAGAAGAQTMNTIGTNTSGNGFLHYKKGSDWVLQFDNGVLFRGIGENLAWESRQNDDSKYFKALHENPKYNYEFMLPSLAAHGGNFFRTWICSWNLPVDWNKGFNSTRYQSSEEYFNPSAIKKMDRLVALSDSLGVNMMLTLGMGAWEVRDGGFSSTAADFFVNPKSRERYKNRLRYFIARWGYSASIAAWELFNEVDNIQFENKESPIPAASIVAWHDEMSTYLKATDPYQHLVTTSISHRDLKGLDELKNIDFNQKHIYKNTVSIPEAINTYEQRFKKPYVIGEAGFEWDWSKNFDDFSAGMDSDFKRGLWYGLFSPTAILPMSWWWEYFDSRGTDQYLAKVRLVSESMLSAGRGAFQQTAVKATAGVTAYAVRCGNTVFIYAFNQDPTAKKLSLELETTVPGPVVTARDCESGQVISPVTVSLTGGKTELSGLSLTAGSDIVLILSPGSK